MRKKLSQASLLSFVLGIVSVAGNWMVGADSTGVISSGISAGNILLVLGGIFIGIGAVLFLFSILANK